MSAEDFQTTVAPTTMKQMKKSLVLPRLLIAMILARLPVKSLLRFRCMSKESAKLIDHPKFAKMHLSKNQKHGIVFPSWTLHYVDPVQLSSTNRFVAVEDEILKSVLQGRFSRSSIHIRGSCRGLISFQFGRSLFFYNPSTKQCKEIMDTKHRYSKCGLGYAETVDDYYYVKIYDGDDRKIVWVYSLREGRWMNFPSTFPFVSSHMTGIPLNGALHWLVYDPKSPNHVIAAFDLAEKKFNKLALPEFMIENVKRRFSFALLGDCLCLFTEDISHRLHLWVMREYGVQESWTKIFTTKAEGNWFLKPLCCLNNDEKTILANIDYDRLLFWDAEDGKFKNVEVEGIDIGSFRPHVCVESLISPIYKNDLSNDKGKLLGYWID